MPVNEKRAANGPPFLLMRLERFSVIAAVVPEVEEVEEIAERRAVERHIGIIVVNDGVREIIAAAMR